MKRAPLKTFLKRLRLSSAMQIAALTLLMPGMVWLPISGYSNPSGGVVAHGAAEIDVSDLAHLKVFQSSDRAVINWESFDISAGELTEFIQPGSGSVALSRVMGGNPSAIFGTLKANGGHILINQNGILVGAGGVVDVGGLNVLSTLDVDDADFMAGGDMTFFGSTSNGVQNFGTITSAEGDVILMGNFVENHGSIGALNGTVALGAGGEILLSSSGDSKISILRAGQGRSGTGVDNTGTITGAAVEMKAHGNVYALAVNNSGTIRATGVNRANGRVVLSATGDGTGSGKIVNTGTIEANNADGSGGEILIDAGVAGEAEIGGTVKADGVGNTAGGTVTVLADIVNVTDGAHVSASGARGGAVMIGSPTSSSVNVGNATIEATGTSGGAGSIQIQGVEVGIDGTLNATSLEGEGGLIEVQGVDVSTTANSIINTGGFASGGETRIEAGGRLFIGGGEILSESKTDQGGRIVLTGDETTIGSGTMVSANSAAGAGQVNVGGGFQGRDASIANATNTTVESGAVLTADSLEDGNAGSVVVWADNDTYFGGSASARAQGVGNGGLIEVSGHRELMMRGDVIANSVSGEAGTVLFDPGNVVVANNTAATTNIFNSTINGLLQGGTSVVIFTDSGDITFASTGLDNDRHDAIQWTNSNASFGVFAQGHIFANTHVRTSGAGSINFISGWGGAESDFGAAIDGGLFLDLVDAPVFTPGPGDDPGAERIFTQPLNPINPEDVWEHYVEAGQFGFGNKAIFINSSTSNRHVVVGSRYGNTNMAGGLLFVTAAQGNTGESDFAHLGFRDSGGVFSPVRAAGVGLDLNNPGSYRGTGAAAANDGDRSPFQLDNEVVVGINDPTYYRDVDGDTIPDGVYAISSLGVLDENNVATGGDPTVIPFANHFMSERSGNWWWQQIDAENPDPLGLGGNIPEMGAGQSANVRADINVVTTGAIALNSGGRHQDYAMIGHGGDSTAWGDDKSLRDGNIRNDRNIQDEWARLYSFNGAQSDRSNQAISRLAPVYGNINVLSGATRDTISYDRGNLEFNLTGTTENIAGVIQLEAWQSFNSSNSTTNIEQNNNSESFVQIGHGGAGQFGSFNGDINVQAGGDINILAGAHTRSHATIGHTVNGFTDWNPPSGDAQVRLFANGGDFDNPNMRKGELFLHADGVSAPRGFYPVGTQGGRYDDDFLAGTTASATGLVHVPGLTGASPKTISGDIRVNSYGNGGVTIRGYSNPDTRTLTQDAPGGPLPQSGDLNGNFSGARGPDLTDDAGDADGLRRANDRRFAGIGHGGSNFNYWANADNERVRVRVVSGVTESVEVGQQDNSTRQDRGMTFMNIVGDIEVDAHNGDVILAAGNDTFDYAYIGHGGNDLSDYETASVVIGDITVNAAGKLDMIGAGVTAANTGAANRNFHSHTQIGHHGRDIGMQYYGGDIKVDVGGDIMMIGGRYRESGTKIGHQSSRGFGQVGGTLSRTENFIFSPQLDGAGIDLAAEVTDSAVTLTFDGTAKVYKISGNTTNVDVTAGGDITMTHPDPGLRETQNMWAFDQISVPPNVGNDYHDIENSPVQIGHGGRDTGAIRNNGDTPSFYLKDKSGDIMVNAGTLEVDPVTGVASVSGGNITLENGAAQEWWTIIGHSFSASTGDRANGPDTVEDSFNVFGNITVNALGDLWLNADHAESNDPINVTTTVGDPAFYNLVRIGHGAVWRALDVITLDDGTLINGIAASSDIVVNVGNDMRVKGGKGGRGTSYAQVGHGYSSDLGRDPARPSGFNGDITVNVENNLTLEATHQAVIEEPTTVSYLPIEAGAAVIGHGGHLLDSDLSGDISVFVGNDLTLTATNRNLAVNDPGEGARDAAGRPIGSFYGIAKIGHFSTELDALAPNQPVVGNHTGDISVIVGNDMTMNGGQTTLDLDSLNVNGDPVAPLAKPIVFAYTQVGHAGPGVDGLKDGNITVLVGNDLTTVDGTINTTGSSTALTNYVMVGHGDWLRDGNTAALPAAGAPGVRSGDITVAVGENANLDHTLIGHADPAVMASSLSILSGSTYVGVSRNTPFFGGTGTLTAANGTVFTSGQYGSGGATTQLRLYMPQRESNLLDATTRLNSRTAYRGVGGTAGVSFTDGIDMWDPTRNAGAFAGDRDEIYLQPDLFWDHTLTTTAFGDPEPGPYVPDWRFNGNASLQEWILEELDFTTLSTTGGNAEEYFALVNPELGVDALPNGQITTVAAPGGLPNVVSAAAGDFGTGTTDYRGASGRNYTIYYDAITPVSLVPPAPIVVLPPFVPPVVVEPIVIVPLPFDFLPFLNPSKDLDDLYGPWLDGDFESYLEGLGLISRLLGAKAEDDGVGIASESEAVESLAQLLGLPVNQSDDDSSDDDDDRERKGSPFRFTGPLHGTFWQFQPFAGQGHYNSFNVFGTVGL